MKKRDNDPSDNVWIEILMLLDQRLVKIRHKRTGDIIKAVTVKDQVGIINGFSNFSSLDDLLLKLYVHGNLD